MKKLNLLSIHNSKNAGPGTAAQRKEFVINLKEKIEIQALVRKQQEKEKQDAKMDNQNKKYYKLKLQMKKENLEENRMSFEKAK